MNKKLPVLLLFCVVLLSIYTTISNLPQTFATGTNLIPNPSVETANGTTPLDWVSNDWGSLKATFTYQTTGQSGSRSVAVKVAKYVSGDAKWYFLPVAVSPNTKYTFSDYYKGNVDTQIMAQFTSTSDTLSYQWLATASVSSKWKQISTAFTTPSNVASVSIFHLLNTNGTLQTDTFSLTAATTATPTPTVTPTSTTTPTPSAPADPTKGPIQTPSPTATPTITATPTTTPSPTVSATPTSTPTPTPTSSPISVQIASPVSNAVISGTTQFSVNLSGGPVAGVQYQLNTANVGTEVTTTPFSYSWNTNNVLDDTYTLTAIAYDSHGNPTTSAPVVITIANDQVNPQNSIPNPSVETISSTNPNLPQSWQKDPAGVNTATYSYLNTGHTGHHSLEINVTSYTSGADDFSYTPQPVLPNQEYLFNDFYQSNVDTELDAEIFLSDGTSEYQYVNTVWQSPSPNWNHFAATIVTPANAVSMVIYHSIYSVGYLITDDYSLTPYNPTLEGFNRGIVTLTYDDNYLDQYTTALPLMQQYNQVGTFYVITSFIAGTGYMTVPELQTVQADGNEIASHTVTHPHLTLSTPADLTTELQQSQQILSQDFATSIPDLATPFGEYNDQVIAAIKLYYQDQRSTDVGFNAKNNLNPYNLVVQNVNKDVTPVQVEQWVQEAQQQNLWLILVYHDIEPTATGDTWSTTPANLQTELQYIHQTGIPVETIHQALQETLPQSEL